MIKLIKKYNEVIRYLIIGILTTLVSLSVYYVLVFTIFDPHKPLDLQIVNIISWVISVTFAYFTNRKFVFKTTHKITIYEAINFYTSRLSTLGIDMFLMYLLVTVCNFNDKIIKLIVQVIIIILNYLLSKFIVFKKKTNE